MVLEFNFFYFMINFLVLYYYGYIIVGNVDYSFFYVWIWFLDYIYCKYKNIFFDKNKDKNIIIRIFKNYVDKNVWFNVLKLFEYIKKKFV